METNLSLLETFDRLERNDGTSALELGIFCFFFLLRESNKFVDFEELKIVDLLQHLAGHDRRETSSSADSDPNKFTVHRNSRSSRKVQKAKGSLHLTAR